MTQWIRSNAHSITTIDFHAPFTDLEPLTNMISNTVIGIGESTRGARSARQIYLIKNRLLRFLVERLGFRSLFLGTDWTLGLQLNEYLRTGDGDPRALLTGQTSLFIFRRLHLRLNYLDEHTSRSVSFRKQGGIFVSWLSIERYHIMFLYSLLNNDGRVLNLT
ncbi:hypothetical protein ACFQZE_04210 [Paenibacillus sp. GCM10027627]